MVLQEVCLQYQENLGHISTALPSLSVFTVLDGGSGITVDRAAVPFIPHHLQGLVLPSVARGDGNCLYRSISIALVSDDSLYHKVKFSIAVTLLMSTSEVFSTFAQLDYDAAVEAPSLW